MNARGLLALAILAAPCDILGGQEPSNLDSALKQVPGQTRALVLVDVRLHKLIAPDLSAYVKAASIRRQFQIAVLPVLGLDDCQPPEIRRAIQDWRAARPALEGILFVGNIKLPSFFMPRGHSLDATLAPLLRGHRHARGATNPARDRAQRMRPRESLAVCGRPQGVRGSGTRL